MGKDKKGEENMSSELRRVAKEGGTEAPFTGRYWDSHEKGVYKCAVCSSELFSSDTKFDSGTGWPSFTEPAHFDHITLRKDTRDDMIRTEVLCRHCSAHLGHVFDDGPKDTGGKRYCINSVCLELDTKTDEQESAE